MDTTLIPAPPTAVAVATPPADKVDKHAPDPFMDALKAGEFSKPKTDEPVPLKTEKPETDKAEPAAEDLSKPGTDIPDYAEKGTKGGKNDWGTLKERVKKAEAKAAELEAMASKTTGELKSQIEQTAKELHEAKAGYDPAEVKRLKEEHADLVRQVRINDVKALPAWKKAFVEPLNEAVTMAVSSVPEDYKDRVRGVLELPESTYRTKALTEILTELRSADDMSYDDVREAAREIKKIVTKRDAALSDNNGLIENVLAGEKLAKEQRSAQEKAEQEKMHKGSFEAIKARIREVKMPGFVEIDGDENHNKAVNEAHNRAFENYTAAEPSKRAEIAYWASLGQGLLPKLQGMAKDLDAANALIKQLQGVAPKTPASTGAKTSPSSKDPFGDAVFRST